MKLPLGALLTFLGYAVLWTGYMNLRVVFQANPGGEPKATGGPSTDPGHLFSLWEAITCQTKSLQPAQPGAAGTTPSGPGNTPGGPGLSLTGPSGPVGPAQPPQTGPGIGPVQLPGGANTNPLTGCPPRQGDTKLAGGFYWRPIGDGFLGQLNGQLIGPC